MGLRVAARVQQSKESKELAKALADVPKLIADIVGRHDESRLTWRADAKTWSASDVIAHLRSCAEVRGKWIAAMLERDNPTLRAVSPRSAFRKYVDRDVAVSLKEFAAERAELVTQLRGLDAPSWARTLTFTGASPRSTTMTVGECARGLVQHEEDHLHQLKALLEI
jgi:uncharacterized damage-inducible protein DinB